MSTDNQVKKYRLLKDLPDSNVGDEYIWNNSMEAYYKNGNVQDSYWKGYAIENNPEWFEEVIEQPKQERIEVELTRGFNTETPYQWISHFYCTKKLSDKDLPKISQAIESVLNNDTVVERGIQDEFDGERIYLKSEVDTIRRETWDAAREINQSSSVMFNAHYSGLKDNFINCSRYKDLDTYLSSLNSKEEKPSPSVNDEWEILSVFADDGKPIYYPSKDILDTTLKNNGERIFSVIRKSDGEVFSVGDEVDVTCSDGKGFRDTISHFTFTKGANIIDVYFKEQLHTAFGVHWLNIAKHSPSPETPPIVKDRVQTSIELMKHYCKSIQFIFDNAGDKNPFIVLEEIRCAERNYEIAKQKLSQ